MTRLGGLTKVLIALAALVALGLVGATAVIVGPDAVRRHWTNKRLDRLVATKEQWLGLATYESMSLSLRCPHRRRWFPQGIKRERGACA